MNSVSTSAVFFAWNLSLPGRERSNSEHFGQFVQCFGARDELGSRPATVPRRA